MVRPLAYITANWSDNEFEAKSTALRYLLRVVRGIRYDFFAIFDALVFVAAVVAIPICWFPKDVWHATIVLLCFVSTVWGISRFRFSPLFMFLNCLIAGAILL